MSLLDYAAKLDGEDDIHLDTFYNVIGQDFLNQIIAECNIFSFKKILKPSTINSVRRFIYKYNKHLYRTIEEYNEDIENIESRVQSQIDNIETVMYNIDNFEQNILEKIYEYSVQYHDMYEYFRDKLIKKINFFLKNELRRTDPFGMVFENNMLYNLFNNNLPNLENLEDLENNDYDNDFINNITTKNIFELEKTLIFNNEMMLLDDFLIYFFTHLFEHFKTLSFSKIKGNQLIYLVITEYIELCESLDIKITLEQFNFFKDILNNIKVPKNKIIYTKILVLSNDLDKFLLDEKNDLDYNYFLQNEKIKPSLIDRLYDMGKITKDMIKDALKIKKYYENLTDAQILKYKDCIDISHLIKKRDCSMTLINDFSPIFTAIDWSYLLRNYNLPDNFLMDHSNKDMILLFLYRNYKEQN